MRDPSAPHARVRHARIELPDNDYQRLRRAAGRVRLPVAAYIRMAVLERVAEEDRRAGIWGGAPGGGES